MVCEQTTRNVIQIFSVCAFMLQTALSGTVPTRMYMVYVRSYLLTQASRIKYICISLVHIQIWQGLSINVSDAFFWVEKVYIQADSNQLN